MNRKPRDEPTFAPRQPAWRAAARALTVVAGGISLALLGAAGRRAARADAALIRRGQETYFGLVQNAPFGVYVVDSQFRLAQVSKGAQKAFANATPFIGRDFAEVMRILWPEPLASGFIARFAHTLASGEAYAEHDLIERRRDIEAQEAYDWRIERVTLPDGGFGVVCYFYDASEREQAQERLRAVGERLQLSLDAADMGCWDWNVESDAIAWDERTREMFGVNAGVAVDFDTFEACLHADDRDNNRRLTERALGSGDYENEFRVEHGDGATRWLASCGRVMRDGAGRPMRMIGVVADITVQKQADDARRRSAARDAFRVALDDALRPLAAADAIREAAARVLGTALGAERVHYGEVEPDDAHVVVARGYAHKLPSVTGRHRLADFGTLIGDCRAGLNVRVADVKELERLSAAEQGAYAQLKVRALVTIPLFEQGRFVALLAVHRSRPHAWSDDEMWMIEETAARVWAAAERARAEQRLAASEERFRSLVSIVTDVSWACDPSGRLASHQPAWAAYTGQEWAQQRGFGWVAAIHADDRERLRAAWQRAVESGRYEVEYRLWHAASAGHRLVIARGMPLSDDNGAVREWVGSCNDVHDERRAAEELRSADRRKDEFLATLAHELRSPLAPIANGLHAIDMAGDDAAAVGRARKSMQRQLAHMVHLVDDLLDVSRISHGKIALRRRRVDIVVPLLQAVETARPAIDAAGHSLQLDLPDRPTWVDADETRLSQVFANLLHNAAKFTGADGRIGLSVHLEAGAVRVAVDDSGAGIPPDMLDRVFDMFSQADASAEKAHGGLGIGLALSRALVELHGGTIVAASDGPGRGSRFEVSLPLAEAPVEAAAAAEPLRPAAGRASRQILVVDDNADSAATLSLMLELTGHQVRTASGGLEALAAAAERMPELVLLDIGMPGMNGYETAQRLRLLPGGSELTLIAQTGWGQDGDRARARDAGFDGHLVKPIDLSLLHALLDGAPPR